MYLNDMCVAASGWSGLFLLQLRPGYFSAMTSLEDGLSPGPPGGITLSWQPCQRLRRCCSPFFLSRSHLGFSPKQVCRLIFEANGIQVQYIYMIYRLCVWRGLRQISPRRTAVVCPSFLCSSFGSASLLHRMQFWGWSTAAGKLPPLRI